MAENYLLDSDASIQAVIGLDIEYGKKGLRMATLLVWRTHADGDELRVVQEIADEVGSQPLFFDTILTCPSHSAMTKETLPIS